ncbi:MAG TPA: YraN family protein [Steroidobacteraceae bacterium]|nr:YraN family protein [Steroidobacteraceae bacterium]
MNARQQLGRAAEDAAAAYLTAQGHELILRNYHRRMGELDLIARRGEVLAIVEVRTRSSEAYGGAAASIDAAKRRRIIRASRALLQQHAELARLHVRFDVIVVSDAGAERPRIEWIQHAFT